MHGPKIIVNLSQETKLGTQSAGASLEGSYPHGLRKDGLKIGMAGWAFMAQSFPQNMLERS